MCEFWKTETSFLLIPVLQRDEMKGNEMRTLNRCINAFLTKRTFRSVKEFLSRCKPHFLVPLAGKVTAREVDL